MIILLLCWGMRDRLDKFIIFGLEEEDSEEVIQSDDDNESGDGEVSEGSETDDEDQSE